MKNEKAKVKTKAMALAICVVFLVAISGAITVSATAQSSEGASGFMNSNMELNCCWTFIGSGSYTDGGYVTSHYVSPKRSYAIKLPTGKPSSGFGGIYQDTGANDTYKITFQFAPNAVSGYEKNLPNYFSVQVLNEKGEVCLDVPVPEEEIFKSYSATCTGSKFTFRVKGKEVGFPFCNMGNTFFYFDDVYANPVEPVKKPDLTVSSISINPGGTRGEDIVRVYVNESNNISAVVWNNGTANAGAFDVCFDVIGFKIDCVEVASLAAGANTTVSFNWRPDCGEYPVMPYYYIEPGFPAQSLPTTINVTADCNEEIAESDETDNLLSKFIPAIQQYAGYDVIGGVVNNGYKSKNFDCNTTEEPLTLSEYDSEIVGGGIVYNVSGEKISSFAPGDTSARVHHIDIPDGATVKKARLYVYWYDKWGNYKTYPTGCLADLSVTIGGTEFMPEVKYNDQKGFGYYHSPKGTYAYDVTSKVTGSGDYTVIVENIDPNNGTTLLGEMLYVAYEDPTKTDKIQLWTLEGNDHLMAADDTHGSYNYGVSPEEATATVAFPGSIDVANVRSATLITVVAQGMASGSDMLFNGEVVKTDAWDAPTEAYSGSKINVESVDVTAKLSTGGNNIGFLDNGTNGMQASNAILVVEYKHMPAVSITVKTDKFKYCPCNDMLITIDISNPTKNTVTFNWYLGIPQFGYWLKVYSNPIPAGSDETIPVELHISEWSKTPFSAVWYVDLQDPKTGDELAADCACWSYSPWCGPVPEEMPVSKPIPTPSLSDIAAEIGEEIEGVA